MSYTDFWEAYKSAIPRDRHHAVGKESGQTNHIEPWALAQERFDATRIHAATLAVYRDLLARP